MEWSELKDITIAVAALTGMMLGLWNLFADHQRKKVKLEVNPKSASWIGTTQNGYRALKYSDSDFSLKGEPDLFAIEVINMRDFPVTISEVGFHAPKEKVALLYPNLN